MNSIHQEREKFMNKTDLGKFKKNTKHLVYLFSWEIKYFGWVDNTVCRGHEKKKKKNCKFSSFHSGHTYLGAQTYNFIISSTIWYKLKAWKC